MKNIAKAAFIGLVLATGAVAAKEGVTNPVVKDRMDTMQIIRGSVATLGDMASGKTAYDAAAATEARTALAAAAATVPAKFEPQESDPVSEAKPEIWLSFEDFVAKSENLLNAAESLDPSSLDSVRTGMGAVGGSCRECHSVYRM